MSLTSQPPENIIAQLMHLDYDGVLAASRAYPELEELALDERLWRQKLIRDYPEFPLPPDGFRTTYYLLQLNDLEATIEVDRVDVFVYQIENGPKTHMNVLKLAVRRSSVKLLDYLIDVTPSEEIVSPYIYAIKTSPPEVFLTFAREYSVMDLVYAYAVMGGNIELLNFLLRRLDPEGKTLFTTDVQSVISLNTGERRAFRQGVEWVLRNIQLSPLEENHFAVAVVLDSAEMLKENIVPVNANYDAYIEYALRFGTYGTLQALIDQGIASITTVRYMPIWRLDYLLSLGVEITERVADYDFDDGFYMEPDMFFHLLDRELVSPAALVLGAVVLYFDQRDNELLEGVIERRQRGSLALATESMRQELGYAALLANHIDQILLWLLL